MFFQLLISTSGLLIIFRNIHLLEKIGHVSRDNRANFFILLSLPIFFSLVFKELFVFCLLYIGIFLITLILKHKIIIFFEEKSFEKAHLRLIDELILQIKAGKSAQSALQNVFTDQNSWQKHTILQFQQHLDEKKMYLSSLNNFQHLYLYELATILSLKTKMIDQLRSFRRFLSVRQRLIDKMRRVTRPIYVQTAILTFVYVGVLTFSQRHLGLKIISFTTGASVFLFILAQVLIFKIGKKIKWKI